MRLKIPNYVVIDFNESKLDEISWKSKEYKGWAVVTYALNPSIWEAEAGGSLRV